MNINLLEISDISLGTILTRVKPKTEFQNTLQIPTISMQELSFECGKDDTVYEEIISKIDEEKKEKCLFTNENDVVIGLSSQNAMVISKKRAGKLLLSNFCLVRIKDTDVLDPYYFVWIFNESLKFKKQLTESTQGIAYVKMITLDTIRSLCFEVPNIETQRRIGQLYIKSIERDRCLKREIELKRKLLNYRLENL